MDLGNLPIDSRLDYHHCDRLDGADRADLDRRRHLDGDVGHHGLTGRRPCRLGIGAFVKDKTPKVVPKAEQDDEQTCKKWAFHSTSSPMLKSVRFDPIYTKERPCVTTRFGE